MSLLQDIRRRLLGQQAMVMPGQGMGGATQGLIGTGGEMGGGLLQENFNKMNTAEGGLLSNIPQSVLLGAALYGEGMKGKNPLEGLFPALTQTAQLQRLITPKRTELEKNLIAAGYKPGSDEYKAALQAYLTRGKKATLSDEVLNVYNKVKGLSGEDFDNAFAKLSDAEQSIYKNKIEGRTDIIDELISEGIEASNKPIQLDVMPDKSKLIKGQKYQIDGKTFRWNGEEMIPSN